VKICIVSTVIDGKDSGIGNYVIGLLMGLIKFGHAEDIVLVHSQKCENPLYRIVQEEIIPFKSIGKHQMYFSAKHMNNVLEKNGCGLIHFPAFFKNEFGLYHATVPIVLTLPDIIPLMYPKYSTIKDYLTWGSLVRSEIRKVSHLITISEYSKSDLVKYLHVAPEKITVTYPAPDPIFRPFSKKDELQQWAVEKYNLDSDFLMYTGALDLRKNVPTLIKAFNKLKRRGFPHKLLIIGRKIGKFRESLEAIEESPFAGDIIRLEYVEKEDLVKFYNLASVFVFPSLYEGFGLPPLEAMACGTPTITSNVTSLPEVVGDSAITVDPYEVDELSNALEKVLSDKNLRQKLSEKGIERSKAFNWVTTAQKTWRVYEEVLENA